MNGFAALDIHPHRRYVVNIGGRRSSRCRLHINFALFLHSLDFTQNLGVTQVDRPAAGLEHDSCTDGDLLRRAYARVTPLCLDVKGQMNGFAALDIHPHRRYVVDIGGRRSSRCRLHINFALFLLSLDFTQNLGVTRNSRCQWSF